MHNSNCKHQQRMPPWPLWSLLWRSVLFGPIIWTVGLFALSALIVAILAPPIYVVILALGGQYFLAVLVFAVWLAWLPWSRRLWRWMMQGEEYGSL